MPSSLHRRLQSFLEFESEPMEVEAYNKRSVQILRANVVVLIAEHSKKGDLGAYIPYLALITFDQFISRNELPTLGNESVEYRVRVLALSCLFHAWGFAASPLTNEYLENITDLDINKRDVCKVEILISEAIPSYLFILNAIRIVPNFLSLVEDPFFPIRSSLISNVKELIVQSQRDINFTLFKPSVIAASAILCLLGPNSRNMQKIRDEYVKLDLHKVCDCMRMMTEFRKKMLIPGDEEAEDSIDFEDEIEEDHMNFELKWINDENQDLTIDPSLFPPQVEVKPEVEVKRPKSQFPPEVEVKRPSILAFLIKLLCCKEMD